LDCVALQAPEASFTHLVVKLVLAAPDSFFSAAALSHEAAASDSLRHTHASTLIRAGVDILTVSRRLGHNKASVTLDTYGHLIEGADAATAKAIEGVIKCGRQSGGNS
jgi:integrase